MTAPVAGLQLAAGAGSRFGCPKALVDFDGEYLAERGIRLMMRAGLEPRVVVLGAMAEQIRRRLDLADADVVVNAAWESGMASSLRCGLEALRGRAAAVVVTLVDQPLVGVAAIERLVEAWRDGASAAVATYAGEAANPVLLDESLWNDVASAAGADIGARGFLREHPEIVTAVACDDTGTAADIDTPGDLALLLDRAQRRYR